METIASNNQLTVIDKSLEVFKGGSAILLSHQNRAAKALKVAGSILKQWEEAYAIEDPEEKKEALSAADQRSNDFLHNCGQAKVQMEESRKAITQLMDMIKKMFTEEENKLDPKKDTIPASIQSRRNAYAKYQFEEQERIRKEAEFKADKAKEAVDVRSSIKNNITQRLLDYTQKRLVAITNSFNAISLADFDEKAQKLKLLQCSFPLDKLKELIETVVQPSYCKKHTNEEVQDIMAEEKGSFDFPAFCKEYERKVTELKLSLIDKLPSKKQELEQIARADADEKIRLENERINREAEERKRMEEEAEREKQKAEQLAEVTKASGTAQVLFDQAVESSLVTPAPEARVGYEINVLHPAGWVEIFQFWFQREGCTMNVADMGKKSLTQMKSFAEAAAKKDEVLIESKHLKYETSIKSVNRKTGK